MLAGAHAADGHLSKRGVFYIGDEDKNNIKIIANLIKKEFGFLPSINKRRNENEYVIQFMSKRFYTFFNEYFNFPLGPKTYTIRVPDVIKGNKTLEKAFVAGAMTFESSVNTNRSIIISVTSQRFRDDIASILSKDRIKIKTSQQIKQGNRKKQYTIRTSEDLIHQELDKWLNYYIRGSEKWFKILDLSNGFFGKPQNIQDAKIALKSTYYKGRKVKTYDLIEIIKNLNQTDTKYLYKKLRIGKTTLMKYLKLLNRSNIIKKNKTPLKLNLDNLSKNTHITLADDYRKDIFNKINNYHGHDAKVCRLLQIKDFVYCRWRNGEKGIPLDKLKILLKLSKTYNKHLNIKKVDREIIEFNKKVSEWQVPWRPWLENIELDTSNDGVKKWIITK